MAFRNQWQKHLALSKNTEFKKEIEKLHSEEKILNCLHPLRIEEVANDDKCSDSNKLIDGQFLGIFEEFRKMDGKNYKCLSPKIKIAPECQNLKIKHVARSLSDCDLINSSPINYIDSEKSNSVVAKTDNEKQVEPEDSEKSVEEDNYCCHPLKEKIDAEKESVAKSYSDYDLLHVNDCACEKKCSTADKLVKEWLGNNEKFDRDKVELYHAYDCASPKEREKTRTELKRTSSEGNNSPSGYNLLHVRIGACEKLSSAAEKIAKDNIELREKNTRRKFPCFYDCVPLKRKIKEENKSAISKRFGKSYSKQDTALMKSPAASMSSTSEDDLIKYEKELSKYEQNIAKYGNDLIKYNKNMIKYEKDLIKYETYKGEGSINSPSNSDESSDSGAQFDFAGESNRKKTFKENAIKANALRKILPDDEEDHRFWKFKTRAPMFGSPRHISLDTSDEDLPEFEDTAMEDESMSDEDSPIFRKNQDQTVEKKIPLKCYESPQPSKKIKNGDPFELYKKYNSDSKLVTRKIRSFETPKGINPLKRNAQTIFKLEQKKNGFQQNKDRSNGLSQRMQNQFMPYIKDDCYDNGVTIGMYEKALLDLKGANLENQNLQLKVMNLRMQTSQELKRSYEDEMNKLMVDTCLDLAKTVNTFFVYQANNFAQTAKNRDFLKEKTHSFHSKYADMKQIITEIAQCKQSIYKNLGYQKQTSIRYNLNKHGYCSNRDFVQPDHCIHDESNEAHYIHLRGHQNNLQPRVQRKVPVNEMLYCPYCDKKEDKETIKMNSKDDFCDHVLQNIPIFAADKKQSYASFFLKHCDQHDSNYELPGKKRARGCRNARRRKHCRKERKQRVSLKRVQKKNIVECNGLSLGSEEQQGIDQGSAYSDDEPFSHVVGKLSLITLFVSSFPYLWNTIFNFFES